MKQKLLLVLFAFLFSYSASATHMAGADLTYQSLGNGQYLITYTFYRDCIGIPAQASHPLDIISNSCGINLSATLLPVPGTGQLISQVCPGALTTCDGGTATGIQEWEYTAIVQLSGQCVDWMFGVGACCRNAAITTMFDASSENMYLEAHLNNSVTDNNSPTFSNIPIGFICFNQDNYFNHGGLDVDGDSLVYSFTLPQNAANDPLTYNSGYSLSNPLTSTPPVTLNSVTGDIFMHPTVLNEVAVIAVRIDEYRNGVLIGSVIRDIQVYVINCNNQLPTATGINGTNQFSLTECVGGPICFDIFTNDPDFGDTVTAIQNNGIPAAAFTIDTLSGPFPIVHFCWSPTVADVRPQPYVFTITVSDNACPMNGVQSYAYSIYLQDLQATVNTTDVSCNGGHNGTIQIVAPSGTNYQYMTSPVNLPFQNITHLAAGPYTVNVANPAGCLQVYYVNISEPPPLSVNVSSQNATCSGAQASATASPSGGSSPYQYQWSTSPLDTTNTISNIGVGTYNVIITDDHNCTTTGSAVISQGPSFIASMTATPATCNANDGSASVTVSGGSGNFSYVWQPNVSSGPNANNIGANIYTVTITDNVSGCTQIASAIVNGTTGGLNVSISSTTNATCESGEDGTASVLVTGGIPPYTYLWMPGGQTTANVNNLMPGQFTVQVADYAGCPTYLTGNIGYNFPAPVVDLGPDTMMCIGDVLTLDGGAGQTYLWNDNSTAQTLAVTGPGVYTVLVTDQNGCEGFDQVNVTYSNCIVQPNISSNSLVRNQQVIINPNPVIANAQLMFTNFPKGSSYVRIVNSLGHVVWQNRYNVNEQFKTSVDLSMLTPGFYLMEVVTDTSVLPVRFVKM